MDEATHYPAVGDYWEIKLPGKRRKTKEVGAVEMRFFVVGYDENRRPINKQLEYVEWARLPKGRYSGIKVSVLMKYGRRISTKAERDARIKESVERRKRERAQIAV